MFLLCVLFLLFILFFLLLFLLFFLLVEPPLVPVFRRVERLELELELDGTGILTSFRFLEIDGS
jgi:hypothetical protein